MVVSIRKNEILALVVLLAIAAGLWFWIFAVEQGNFWIKLTLSASVLASSSALLSGKHTRTLFGLRLTDLPIGVLSATLLYGIFYAGNIILTALFPAAEAGIKGVYAEKSALPSLEAGIVLLSLTAIAEEVFWRGFVQRLLVKTINVPIGIVIGVIFYSGVHAWTLNGPLILAAGVAGAFWALQFHLVRRLPSVILSHAIWSTSIFFFFPVAA